MKTFPRLIFGVTLCLVSVCVIVYGVRGMIRDGEEKVREEARAVFQRTDDKLMIAYNELAALEQWAKDRDNEMALTIFSHQRKQALEQVVQLRYERIMFDNPYQGLPRMFFVKIWFQVRWIKLKRALGIE